MKIKTTWKKPSAEIIAQMRKKIDMALDMTAIELTNNVVLSLNIGYPPPSDPWQPPHKRTGHLARSIGWMDASGDSMARWIGTNIGTIKDVGYALWLEYGTRPNPRSKQGKGGIQPRPFLRPAMYQGRDLLAMYIRKVFA